ncbi:MAG: sugar transferase, partial [Actinobacteria bacterium]|nr:sugar transferase [Actinomycetota bacterium]
MLEVPAASELSRTPVRTESAVARTSRWYAALRFGVMPVLLAADVLAFAVAVALPGAASGLAVVLGALIVCFYAMGGLYRSRAHLSVLDDLPSLLGRVLLAGACVTLVDLLTDGYEGRETVAITVLFAVLVVCGRSISYTLVRHARRRGVGRTRTLILGSDDTAHQLAEILLDRPEYGLHPVGFLDAESSPARDRTPVPHLGSTDELTRVVRETDARAVVIAFGSTPDPLLVDVLRRSDT